MTSSPTITLKRIDIPTFNAQQRRIEQAITQSKAQASIQDLIKTMIDQGQINHESIHLPNSVNLYTLLFGFFQRRFYMHEIFICEKSIGFVVSEYDKHIQDIILPIMYDESSTYDDMNITEWHSLKRLLDDELDADTLVSKEVVYG